MQYTFRVTIALLAFLLGIAAFLFWSGLRTPRNQLSTVTESNHINPISIAGQVSFRFLECAGKRSVFILENQTDHPIYVRVERADYWKEYKDANMELGVHFIDYKAPDAQAFKHVSPAWDALIPFRIMPPHTSIRYGVYLWKEQGEYKVSVPYLEDAEVARRLDEDFDHVEASWKEVTADTVTNRCQ